MISQVLDSYILIYWIMLKINGNLFRNFLVLLREQNLVREKFKKIYLSSSIIK